MFVNSLDFENRQGWVSVIRRLGFYILENFKTSFALWGATTRGGTLLAALVALGLTTWGLKFEWQPESAEYWARLIGAWFLALVFIVTPVRMWMIERAKVDELSALPQRISLIDFAKSVRDVLGWDYSKAEGLQANDLLKALRQAASDGAVVMFGREGSDNIRERDKEHLLLVEIPAAYWRDRYIDVPLDGFPEVSNYEVRTRTADFGYHKGYRDLHVASSSKALAWLKGEDAKWRGITSKAELEAQEEHRKTMAPVQRAAEYISRTSKGS